MIINYKYKIIIVLIIILFISIILFTNVNIYLYKLKLYINKKYKSPFDIVELPIEIIPNVSIAKKCYYIYQQILFQIYFNNDSQFQNEELKMVDPFLKGKETNRVAMNNMDGWLIKGWTPQYFTYLGARAIYKKFDNDTIIWIFAGPDKDIDNDISHITKENLIDVPYPTNFTNVLPQTGKLKVLQYDPTNGIKSNGDIVWILKTKDLDKYHRISSKDWLKKYDDEKYDW